MHGLLAQMTESRQYSSHKFDGHSNQIAKLIMFKKKVDVLQIKCVEQIKLLNVEGN
jgi:hypothetical protein